MLAIFLVSYLIGSIPFGLILTRLAGLGDIRSIGSGNIGATNVLRTGNKKLALAVLLLDGAKGFVAVKFASALWAGAAALAYIVFNHASGLEPQPYEETAAAMVGVVVGHVFPIWLKFKGGKGVATLLGAWLGFGWFGLVPCIVWLLAALIFRYSSLAAIVAVASVPLIIIEEIVRASYFSNFPDNNPLPTELEWQVLLPQLLVSSLVIWRHKDNIKRLRAGTEPKIGASK